MENSLKFHEHLRLYNSPDSAIFEIFAYVNFHYGGAMIRLHVPSTNSIICQQFKFDLHT